jgi:hypothetical protein
MYKGNPSLYILVVRHAAIPYILSIPDVWEVWDVTAIPSCLAIPDGNRWRDVSHVTLGAPLLVLCSFLLSKGVRPMLRFPVDRRDLLVTCNNILGVRLERLN